MRLFIPSTPAAAVAILLLILAPCLRAGFQFPGGWDGRTLGDGTNSPADRAATAGTRAGLGALINAGRAAAIPPKPPLAGAELAAAADAAFDAVRCNVKQMVDLVACGLQAKYGDDAAKCARDAFAKGRVCVDFGDAGQGGQWGDTTPAWDKDLININIDWIPLGKVPCWDPLFWRRLLTLYEEMRHAMQDWSPVAGALPGRGWAATQLKAVCNERDVDDEQIALDTAACAGLARLAAGLPHGQTSPLLKKVLDKIAALPAAARTVIALALKASVMADLAFHQLTRPCYDAAKALLQRFITDGTMTEAEVKAALARIRWQIPGQTAPTKQPLIGHIGGPSGGDIKEIIDDADTPQSTIPTGLQRISDLRYDSTGRFLLAAGTVAGGLGSIILLHDANGDGSFGGALPEIIIPPTLLLGDGCSFVPGDTSPYIVFDPGSLTIRRMLAPDLRGIPTLLGPPINTPSPLLQRVCTLRMGTDGSFYGFETQPYDGNYASNMPVEVLTDNNGDGFFESISEESPHARLQFRPAPLHFPHGGQNQVTIHSMAPAILMLHPLSNAGQLLPPIGNANLPPGADTATVNASRPLLPGETLVIFDPGRNLPSVPFRVLPLSLAAWRQLHFPGAAGNPALELTIWGHTADPDLDGADNLSELAHGTSPVNGSQIPSATITPVAGGTQFSYIRRPLDPDITYVPLVATDLTGFSHTLLEEHATHPLPNGMETLDILHLPGAPLPRVFFGNLVRPDVPGPLVNQ